jgi:hypothetical protein
MGSGNVGASASRYRLCRIANAAGHEQGVGEIETARYGEASGCTSPWAEATARSRCSILLNEIATLPLSTQRPRLASCLVVES